MLTNKFFGIKEQVSAMKALENAGLKGEAENLYHSFDKSKDNVSAYLLKLKADDDDRDFELFFKNNPSWKEVWDSPVYQDIIVPLVKYLYKRKFENGYPPKGTVEKREFPSGLLKFGAEKYGKDEGNVVYTLRDLVSETMGDFKYHPGKKFRYVFSDDGVWCLSQGVSSYVPYKVFTKLKKEHTDLIGKEVIVDAEDFSGEEGVAPMEEIRALQDLYDHRNENNKIENLDYDLILANLNIPAQASALTDEEYPVFHELKIKGVQYPVASLSLFVGFNSLQAKEKVSAYASPLNIILDADNGAFSVVKIQSTGIAYSNLVLGSFVKGITIREAEKLDAAPPSTIEVPSDLLERKPILQTILDRQKLLTENIYENLVGLAQEYIASYTEKVMVKKGEIEVEVVRGKLSPENANDYNYVNEVDEIFWQYNSEISIEELLAFFVAKGKDEAHQILCLKVLGIDYMYHFDILVDALIESGKLMIEHIRVDAETKVLKELKYSYLYQYASGKIYEKIETLKDNQNHIINYYGEKAGLNIVSSQGDILQGMIPTPCSLVAVDKDRQLELDWSNNIFWENNFPELQVKGSKTSKTIRKLFEDFLQGQEIFGGITPDMIRDGYMYGMTQNNFIGGWVEHKGKLTPHGYILPGWKHDGKKVTIESPSFLDILQGIFQKRPRMVPKINRKTKKPYLDANGNQLMVPKKLTTKDFTPEQRAEARQVYNAIRTKYYAEITAVKIEGSRLFNMLLRNDLTGASQEIVASRWNERFNSFQSPKEVKMPVFMRLARYFGTDISKPFELNEVQLGGIKFTSSRDNNALIAHEVGLGKAEWIENKIFTPTGTKRMGDIQVGDFVMGSDGKPTKVSGIFPQGEKEMYRVHFSDKSSVVVCGEHLWQVQSFNQRFNYGGDKHSVLTTKEILEKGITNGRDNLKWMIPITKPVEFEKQNVWIDPYTMGVLLGDGCLREKASIRFASADLEIVESVKNNLPINLQVVKIKDKEYEYRITREELSGIENKEGNPLNIYLRHYGLMDKKSYQKFIPKEYKYNSVENRIEILRGLMDTDGYVALNKTKTSSLVQYTTTSKQLSDDVTFLIQSLGGIVTLSTKIPQFTYKGEKKNGRLAYTLTIRLPEHINPFRLKRKADLDIPKFKYKPNRFISKIEPVGNLEAKCIMVEAADHLYLTENFIVTHNTAYALATISHLFETNTLSRVLLMTPTRVYDKFLKEAKGAGNFRGLIPHINIVELENAKPNKFEPVVNEKTGEIIKNKLKKYTSDEYKVYKMYKAFIVDIENTLENDFTKFPNKRFEVNQVSIDLLDTTLSNYIPGYRVHPFLANMMDDFIAGKAGYEALINQKIALIVDRDAKQNIVTSEDDKEVQRIKYGKLFSSDVTLDMKAMKNKILDELGYYFPENLLPKTIVMATHVALQELRPGADSVTKSIHIVDDTTNFDEARDNTKEWQRTIGNQAVSFEKLKIDGVIIDEAHNFNELVSHVRTRYIKRVGGENADSYDYAKLQVGHGDSIGKHLFRYWYKIGETDARKITALSITQEVKSRIMLSATPFTEGPLHAYSMMNLVNSKRLEEMDLGSSYNFFENFIFEIWKIDTKNDKTGLYPSVEKYRNGAALCNFMSAFADFKMGGEAMRSVRPDKYIIPDEEQVLNGVTSYIPHNPAQEYLKERISDFLNNKIAKKEDICNAIDEEEDIELFEIYDKNDKNYNKWVATEQQIIDYLEQQKAGIPKFKDGDAWEKNLKRHGLAAREVELDGNGNINGLIKEGNASKAFLKEARVWQAASMQAQINISPYFIGCAPPGNILPPLEDVMKDANGDPILIDGLPVSMTAENFVVNSPKIWYAVECIRSVLEHHRAKGEAPSGQIIYMNMGKSFKYDGLTYDDSGKFRNRGSAFTLIKRYIAGRIDIDLSEDEIGILHAGVGEDTTKQIMEDFNNGKIKVLIGSSTIREGIDLQMNSSVMYILQSEFNPTNAIQLEGRIWRQGNKWLNVRMVYVLSYNSSDIFVYSKVKGKINSIREIMRAGRCDMNETNIFSLNPEEIQMALNTNSEEKAKMWWQGEKKKILDVIERLDKERNLLKLVKREYPKIKEKYVEFIGQLNTMGAVLEKVKMRDLVDKVVQELRRTEKQKIRAELEKEANELIKIGKYNLTGLEAHKDLTLNMNHSDFIERLNYIRVNYRWAETYQKLGKREELRKQSVMEIGDLTRQEIYWKTIYLAGFENYSDFRDTAEKFLTGRAYDKILSAYNSLIIAGKKQFSDIDDVVETIERETKTHAKRIDKSEVEIAAQKLVYDTEMEKKKKAGAFSITMQRDAFISTNYLLVPRNP